MRERIRAEHDGVLELQSVVESNVWHIAGEYTRGGQYAEDEREDEGSGSVEGEGTYAEASEEA